MMSSFRGISAHRGADDETPTLEKGWNGSSFKDCDELIIHLL